MDRIRVLLADDHRMLVDAFSKILEPDFDVVGTVGDGRAVLVAAKELQPDVILLDISMPLLNGLDACGQLRKIVPDAAIVFVTVHDEPEIVAEAFRKGASGYLLKNSAGSELIEAIEQVTRGRTYITPLVAKDMTELQLRRPGDEVVSTELTARQREVLQLVAEGYSMKETARILDLSPRTIAFHKYRIMELLKLKTTPELVQFAIKKGIISVSSEPQRLQ